MKSWQTLGLVALVTLSLSACGNNDSTDTGDLFPEATTITVGPVEDFVGDGGDDSFVEDNPGQLTLNSETLNFAQVNIGTPDVQTLRVANTGSGNLRIDSFQLTEDNADQQREFTPVGEDTLLYFNALAEGKTLYIAPEYFIDLQFEWRPANTTQDSGAFRIASSDPNNRERSVMLVTPELGPAISVENEIRFPRVAAGDRGERLTFVQNTGKSPLQLRNIVLSPSTTTDFAISFADPGDLDNPDADSENFKTQLEPGEKLDMRVVFTPDSDAPSSAKIIVKSNDTNNETVEIDLVGNAGSPCIKLGGVQTVETPATDETHSLNFGLSQIGRATTKTVTIENCSRTQDLEVRDLFFGDDGGGKFEFGAVPEGLDGDGVATIKPLETATFEIDYTPEADETNSARVVLTSNDEVNQELRIDVSGKGTDNVCPVAVAVASILGSSGRPDTMISTIPLKTIQLKGDANSRDPDGSVERYEWNIVSKPVNSTARLNPSASDPAPRLFLDLAGEYVIELTVYDALGLSSCETSQILIQATPDEDIHVQLVWNTPSDNDQTDGFGTDVDLHYLNPLGRWDGDRYDCFWRNVNPDWGVPGDPNDDPSLDIDDTDGAGPENVNHDNPESGKTYTIGVYYYNSNGLGVSYATVRVYIEGTLEVELKDKFLEAEDTFWEVGSIPWPNKIFLSRDILHSNGFPTN